jgi:hypothetical protein
MTAYAAEKHYEELVRKALESRRTESTEGKERRRIGRVRFRRKTIERLVEQCAVK